MEEFREKLKVETIITCIFCSILLIFIIVVVLAEAGIVPLFTPNAGDNRWHSNWRGFTAGAATGVLALMLLGIVRSIKALKDSTRLKKLYVQSRDERKIQIWTMARAQSMRTSVMLGLVAGIIAGYFSIGIGITLIIYATAQSWIGLAFKVYYSKKI